METHALSFIARMTGRELRRQWLRLAVIALCLAVGFMAFFATYGFASRMLAALSGESRSLLGADVALSTSGVMDDALKNKIQDPAILASTQLIDTTSMASVGDADGPTRLVEVRAVDEAYPLLGKLEDLQGAKPKASEGIYVERALAEQWNLRTSDGPLGNEAAALSSHTALRIGSGVLPIRGIISVDESRQASAFTLGPRVYMSLSDAKRLGLVSAQARLSSRVLMTVQNGQSERLARKLREVAKERRAEIKGAQRVRVQTHEEAASDLARPLRNLNRFIQQLGLATLLLAMLGAWAILTAFLESRTRDAAILRCLGAAPQTPTFIYSAVTLTLLATSLALGLGAGLAVAQKIPTWLGDLVPVAARNAPTALPPLLETLAALTMLLLLTLPPLIRLGDVKPLVLLREGPEPTSGRRTLSRVCAALAAVLAILLIVRNAPSLLAGVGTAAGMALLFSLLYTASRLLLRFFRRAERLPLAFRLALGQLSARRSLTALMMAVMGLAIFLTLSTQFIKDDLVAPILRQRGGGSRPNLFFLDVQPDQFEALRAQLIATTHREPFEAPLVRARLTSVGGKSVREEEERIGQEGSEEARQANAFRTREQNLSYRDKLGAGESVIEGAFWKDGNSPSDEASLEEGFAKSIGAKLGDALALNIQGQEVTAKVTSLRKVNWQTFQPNFFILLHPSLLKAAPRIHLVALEVEDESLRSRVQRETAEHFPNVTAIDVSEVVKKISRVLDAVALVARALSALMIVSSLLVLTASLIAGRLGRQKDLALLRTLGAPHTLLLRSLVWEFLLLGGSAALIAGALAHLLAYVYATRVLELNSSPNPVVGLALLILASSLTLVVGLLGSLRSLQAVPMTVLRSE
jgi:putative ABC transport system permease protein